MLLAHICKHPLSSTTSPLPHGTYPVDHSKPYCKPCALRNCLASARAHLETLRNDKTTHPQEVRQFRKFVVSVQIKYLRLQREQEEERRRAMEAHGVVIISAPPRTLRVRFEDSTTEETGHRSWGQFHRASANYEPGRWAAGEGTEFWNTSNPQPEELASSDEVEAMERFVEVQLRV